MSSNSLRVVVLIILIFTNGCGKMAQNNPLAVVTSTKTGNPFAPSSFLSISPFESGVTVTLCVKEIELEVARGFDFDDGDEIDIEVYREITISPSGSDLGIDLPAATYSEIEFEVRNACGTGISAQVTNEWGTFSTRDNIDLRFTGEVERDNAPAAVQIMFDEVASKLAEVKKDSQIKRRAEAQEGSY